MTVIKRIVCFMLLATLMLGCFQVGHAMVIEVPDSNNSSNNNNTTTEPEEKEEEIETESTFVDNGATGATASPSASPAATNAPVAEGTLQYGKTNKAGVNIRHGRNTTAKVAGKIPNTGTAVIIKAEQESKKGELWYEVIYGKVEGFIRADLLDLITSSEYTTLAAAQEK